jgi:hypothetical protein
MERDAREEKEKTRLNVGLDPEVAQALKEYCVRTTGGLKKLSVCVNDAVKMYLESKGVNIDENLGKSEVQVNPPMATELAFA